MLTPQTSETCGEDSGLPSSVGLVHRIMPARDEADLRAISPRAYRKPVPATAHLVTRVICYLRKTSYSVWWNALNPSRISEY